MMKDLIAALKANGPRVKPKVRLLYTGGHADNPELFRSSPAKRRSRRF